MENKIYSLVFSKDAFKQLKKIQDKKIQAKINLIFQEIITNPYSPGHKFERLKGDKSAYCSKRLNQKDRIYYQVVDSEITVFIISVTGHYSDN